MTPEEKIGRLEALLGRVQRRASEPRPMPMPMPVPVSQLSPKATTGAMAAAPVMHATTPASAAANRPVPAEPAQSVQPPTPATPRVSEPPANAFPTSPPEAPEAEPPAAAGPSTIPPVTTLDAGSEGEVDVEVSTEMVDIDVDVDVDDMGMPLESGAQPVGDHAALADDNGESGIGDTTMADGHLPVLGPENEVHSEEQPAVQALANEVQEDAPSSSPRPIASEKPETFEDESAPRHTPPPESGKQVAAAPSTPPSRLTSAPPPSLEGHTLIGGWREPGLGGPTVGAPGSPQHAVRVPGPPPATPAAAKQAMPPEPVTGTRPSAPPRNSDRPLSPEVTRADLASAGGANVASFEGAAPAFKPSTFGDLLDASLDL